ncbi:HAMP domain-containing sensor histidine kinase [Spirulina sp. 06S082]|uniref:sensor histidine kinase n=1 Tax=Spirulina sp. 06S082 TaxID=3110248 RepID=UPI002B1EADD9|nr:HAMP domain-containing sensor histidine kinase [Spirulina sp. 06S082]MEA5467540.1 HAMP domain-containing sensor histidine kinase [Spirulina sp. 06S082]
MNELDSHKLGQEILKLLLPSADPLSLLARIARGIGQRLGAVACLLVSDRRDLELGTNGYWCAESYLPEQDSLKKQLLAQLSGQNSSFALPLKCVLMIPTPSEGVIVLGGDVQDKWQDLQAKTLEAIANAVAIAFSQVRLQQQNYLNNAYQVLLEQFHGINAAQPDLDLALGTTATALQVERGAIVLLKYKDPFYNQHDSTAIPRANCTVAHQWTARDDIAKIGVGENFELSDCPYCITAWQQSPQPFAIDTFRERTKNNPRSQSNPNNKPDSLIPSLFNPDRFPALLLVPLIGTASNSSLVLGFFLFQRDRPYRWQTGEMALARWVGAQIATATIYDRTIKQVQSLVTKRTAQLQGSLEVQAKLYEQTRKQVEQLRQLIELKDEFLDSVSHELRTPLTTMKLAIQMLRQPGLPPERQSKYLDLLEREWGREYNLIQDLLALQKLETHQINLQLSQLNLQEIVEELWGACRETWAEKGLELAVRYGGEDNLDTSLLLYSDRDSLQRILQELLANAEKYSDPDSTVYVEIDRISTPQLASETDKKGDRITIAIVNTGAGIAPENIESIFEKFMRGKEANQQAIAGTGLGLALVKGLVQHLNGTIEVSSRIADQNQRGETRFTLVLPQFPLQK